MSLLLKPSNVRPAQARCLRRVKFTPRAVASPIFAPVAPSPYKEYKSAAPTGPAVAPPTTATPPPAPSPSTSNTVSVLSPPQNYQNIAAIGAKKAETPALQTFILGIKAGAYIGLGGLLACAVGGTIPGLMASNPGLGKLLIGLVFPVGLTMVTLLGAELYTGNTSTVAAAVFEGKATWGQLAKNWTFSYLGNIVGSLLLVGLTLASGVLKTNSMAAALATAKCSLPLSEVVVRAILCNWLVCVAVWQAAAATSLPGKLMALWPPIATFVAIGLEHSVANMYFLPLGIACGAQVDWMQAIVRNIIPVTIGNTIAGFFLMAAAYSFSYGSLGLGLRPPPLAQQPSAQPNAA